MLQNITYYNLTRTAVMPPLKLTKTNIESKAKPSSSGDVIYWDTETRGLGLKVTPTGAKTFVLQSRLRGEERDVRIRIGS
jgi:Arm DNA-binding domain